MQVLYPGFLWGLLAICIPVIIHLLQLRRPQRVVFTNTSFIKAVELTTMRRRRLQELVVLLTRVLAVIFLVLIFCQPFIPAAEQDKRIAGQAISVIVDNSLSMQVPSMQRRALLQEAVAGAQLLGRGAGSANRFLLPRQAKGQLSYAVYNAKLEAIQAELGKTSWDDGIAYQPNAGEGQQPLYIFSDFQRSAAGRAALERLPADANMVLVPQQGRSVGNIYVDSTWLDDAFVRTRVNIGLHIRLRNGGTERIEDCPVKVLIGQQQVAAFRVSVAAGQTTTTVVQVQLSETKLALGRIVTEDTPVTFDNTYYFTLQPATTIRVLEIGPVALTQQAYANESLFAYTFTKPQQINYAKLQQANLVLLSELAQVDAGLRQALVQVVKRGGSVVVVPAGDVLNRASYHQLFQGLGIGSEQWNSTGTSTPERQEIALPNKNTPFFKDVFGAQPQRVAMPQSAPVLSWGRNGTDILRLRAGDSYLTEFESGSGKVFVFAAPFDRAYSDVMAHALFVPVLYRLAMLSYEGNQQPAYRLTAASVALAIPREERSKLETGAEATIRLVRDSAVFLPAQRIQGATVQLSIPAEMTTPGFYEVQRQGKRLTTLAFNADKHESELAAYSAAELRELIGPNHPNVRVLDNGQPEAVARYQAEQTGQPLWRYCLLLVLACLLIEVLVLRFGRPRVAAASPAVAA
ncbi:BatA domain-containing protein [Hymenobacter sp. BT559]|uniref:BatA domain-containing protein n=1 Tax=Hymenobacter sp. BT559 TaxID=2795729 RepID=UPI00257228C7|nr:BatA domain-containing protein [Hymenobacter sp. BT559]